LPLESGILWEGAGSTNVSLERGAPTPEGRRGQQRKRAASTAAGKGSGGRPAHPFFPGLTFPPIALPVTIRIWRNPEGGWSLHKDSTSVQIFWATLLRGMAESVSTTAVFSETPPRHCPVCPREVGRDRSGLFGHDCVSVIFPNFSGQLWQWRVREFGLVGGLQRLGLDPGRLRSGNGLWGGDASDGSRTDRWKPSGQMERTARIVIDLAIPPGFAAPPRMAWCDLSGWETGNSHNFRCRR